MSVNGVTLGNAAAIAAKKNHKLFVPREGRTAKAIDDTLFRIRERSIRMNRWGSV